MSSFRIGYLLSFLTGCFVKSANAIVSCTILTPIPTPPGYLEIDQNEDIVVEMLVEDFVNPTAFLIATSIPTGSFTIPSDGSITVPEIATFHWTPDSSQLGLFNIIIEVFEEGTGGTFADCSFDINVNIASSNPNKLYISSDGTDINNNCEDINNACLTWDYTINRLNNITNNYNTVFISNNITLNASTPVIGDPTQSNITFIGKNVDNSFVKFNKLFINQPLFFTFSLNITQLTFEYNSKLVGNTFVVLVFDNNQLFLNNINFINVIDIPCPNCFFINTIFSNNVVLNNILVNQIGSDFIFMFTGSAQFVSIHNIAIYNSSASSMFLATETQYVCHICFVSAF